MFDFLGIVTVEGFTVAKPLIVDASMSAPGAIGVGRKSLRKSVTSLFHDPEVQVIVAMGCE
jgi:hypothetical protein